MKSRVSFIVVFLIACPILLTSCASGTAYQKADAPATKAVIYVYRPSRLLGVALSYSLWDVTNAIVAKKVSIVPNDAFGYNPAKDTRIDQFREGMKYSKKLARLVNGSYYAYTVDPGNYYFIVENTSGIGQGWGVTDAVTKVEAEAGKRYFFYSWVGGGGRAYMETRTVEKGEKEITGCKLVVEEK